MPDHVVKRNDWGAIAPLRMRLKVLAVDPETGEVEKDEAGNPIYKPFDLTNTEVVHLYLKGAGLGAEGKDLLIKTGPMTMENKPLGVVSYAFEKAEGEDPADTAVAGDYLFEAEATQKAGGGVISFPDEGYLSMTIEVDLGP